ncbi:hypothetical protein Cni_G15508 [Canna indica]|uniref:HAT C-terminal dimerisation domain-containing protein n=1 Tax=Canna indica TaxID=4628 RepID=A0AAQ3KDI0_9LILI|nr:hypothetical protein Cni_G15508 [Canna indica]
MVIQSRQWDTFMRPWIEQSSYASKVEAKVVEDIILVEKKFWNALKYCLNCVTPLVKVLRLGDGDSKPAMGYIYEAMDRAKEQIAKRLDNVEKRYKKIWEIIDKRWNYQLHRPLHASAYFLNPKFHYDPNFNADIEVKMGLYKTLDRLSLWWNSYGEECKELQSLAIRVLSLTCSATGCERNWSVFDQIHSKRRNRLEQQRLNALVFVKYNLQLESRQKLREAKGDTYDPICLSDLESDDEWITEREDPCLIEGNSWMDVDECFNIEEGGSSKKRKRGPRNINAYKIDKGKDNNVAILVEDNVIAKKNNKGKGILIEENEDNELGDGGESEEEDDEGIVLLDDSKNDSESDDFGLDD